MFFFNSSRLSISKKITLTYASILFCILLIFSIVTSFMIRNIFLTSNRGEFDSTLTLIENYMGKNSEFLNSDLEKQNLGYNIIYNIYNNDKKLLYTNKKDFPYKDIPMDMKPSVMNQRVLRHDTLIIFMNKKITINGKLYYIQVAKSLGSIGLFTKTIFKVLMQTSLLGIIICFFSGSYLSKIILTPIRNITKTAKELTAKSLDKRIPVNGPDDELKELSVTFNSMLERLESDFDRQRRFAYDASHELRTPLSVIYGNINMLDRWGKEDPEVLSRSLNTLKSETESMNKLIDNLLFLAKSDSNKMILKKEDFLLYQLLKEVVDETLLVHDQYSVSYSCGEEHVLNADYNSIKQLLRILLDNSIKFSSPPGDIEIKAEKINNRTYIYVSDKGCGIPPEAIPFIFDRFYRADESRSKATGGSGLGLAIASQIVQSHKGKISVQSTIGTGTKIEIELP